MILARFLNEWNLRLGINILEVYWSSNMKFHLVTKTRSNDFPDSDNFGFSSK